MTGSQATQSIHPGLLTDEPIDLGLFTKQSDLRAGAQVIFAGRVRNHHGGREVNHLEYSAHQKLAPIMISQILREESDKLRLYEAMAVHRIGRVGLGEIAVVVVTSAAHRAEAYEANQRIIHRIKHEVPIWKKEYFADGSWEWGTSRTSTGPGSL
jgi:molybdopterin synthase catalytic subunit